MDRQQSWELLCEYTQSENLRKHALAVEAFRAKHPQRLPARLANEAELVGKLSSIMVAFERGEFERGRERLAELLATPEAQRLITREARLVSDWRSFVRPDWVWPWPTLARRFARRPIL